MTTMKCITLRYLFVVMMLFVPDKGMSAAPQIRLDAAQSGDFYKAVTALAEQGHVSVIAEGVPLHPHLSALEASKIAIPLSLDAAAKAVADSYDYSVQRDGNVLVFRKLYSNPDDLPVITLKECSYSLGLLQQIAEPLNSHALSSNVQFLAPPGPNLRRDQVRVVHPLLNKFADRLMPEQLLAMHQNKLLVSSLTSDEKTLARQVRCSLYVQPALDGIALLSPLTDQSGQNAVFCWQDTPTAQHTFGYTLPEQRDNQSVLQFHQLSHSTGWEDLGGYVPNPEPAGQDSTAPSLSPVQDMNYPVKTLGAAVANAMSRSGSAIHVTLDPAIATKPVIVLGEGNASTDQILQALADAYGLRLIDHSSGKMSEVNLTALDVRSPANLASLPASLRQAFPEPFTRAAHLDAVVSEEEKFYNFWQTPPYSKRPPQAPRTLGLEETQADLERAALERKRRNSNNVDFNADLNRIKQAEAVLPTLRNAAIKRLRTLIEPKLKTHPNGIPISELGEQEHNALAVIFLVEAAQAAGKLLTQAVPDAVLHFDQAEIGGGIYDESHPPSFEMQFHMPNPVGGLEVNGGGISVPYYKDYDKK